MKDGRGGQRPPLPRTKRQGGEAAERGCGTDHTTVPEGSTRRASPSGGGHRGSERRVGRATTGATRHAPLRCRGTSAAPRACAVLATCLRRRTDSEGAPPPTPFSPTHQGKERGQRGGCEGTWGGDRRQTDVPGEETGGERWRKEKKTTTNKANQRARGTKREDGDQNRGEQGGGRGDMGPHGTMMKYPTTGIWGLQRENPPPPLQPHPVPASCLRHACDIRATKGRRQGRQGK